MSDSTLFRRAYTRGLNADLIRTGMVSYPTKEAADYAADYVADRSDMPDPATSPEAITLKVAHALCESLVAAGDVLCKQAGGYDQTLSKTAASSDPTALAAYEAVQLMQKVAYEQETPNTAEEAAQASSGARLDMRNRPAGYAESGVGNAADEGKGVIGHEESAHCDEGEMMAEKEAMDRARLRLRKQAENPYAGHPNTAAAAAAMNDGAALDQRNRGAGYANVGVGVTSLAVPASAVTGAERKASRGDAVSGQNSVTALSKSAEILFHKTAKLAVAYLPEALSDREKVAHITAMSTLNPRGQAKYLNEVYVAYGADKTASANLANSFFKVALDELENEGKEDFEVAKAMEQAAEEIEDKAVEKMTDEEPEEKSEETSEGKSEDEMVEKVKEAAVKRLQDAARKVASPRR